MPDHGSAPLASFCFKLQLLTMRLTRKCGNICVFICWPRFLDQRTMCPILNKNWFSCMQSHPAVSPMDPRPGSSVVACNPCLWWAPRTFAVISPDPFCVSILPGSPRTEWRYLQCYFCSQSTFKSHQSSCLARNSVSSCNLSCEINIGICDAAWENPA